MSKTTEKDRITNLCKDICREILTWETIDVSLNGDISIETQTPITYNMLDKLSKAFKTDFINLSSESRTEGYCETCRYTYTVNVISIRNAKFNIEDTHV